MGRPFRHRYDGSPGSVRGASAGRSHRWVKVVQSPPVGFSERSDGRSLPEVVTVTVLVDGYAPQVVCVSAPLVDVQVREGTERMPPTPQASFGMSVRRLALAFVAGGLFVLLAVWLPAL